MPGVSKIKSTNGCSQVIDEKIITQNEADNFIYDQN